MAQVKPLKVNTDGSLAQMGAGEQVPPSNLGSGTPTASLFLRGDGAWAVPTGSAPTIYEATLDFGQVPVGSRAFSWSDANATTTSKILMSPSASPASGRSFDEMEMDNFACAAVCLVNGTISAAVVAHPGPVTGQYKFNYILG